MKTPKRDLVFLFDVDNTLLDNDRVQRDLYHHLARSYGPRARERYIAIFEELRKEIGYADYLGALERYRLERPHDPRLLRVANWLVDYPFAKRLYPHVFEVIQRVKRWGQVVILSDGDAVFQPRKICRSGLWQAFGGRVLVFIHKEEMLADVRAHVSGASLCDDRRQAPHPGSDQERVEEPRDYGVSQAGTLRT